MTKKLMEPRVMVLLPAYNEEVTITSTVKNIQKRIPQASIVVIDNASRDRTSEIARELGTIVLHEPRQGKGYAVQRGFDYAISQDVECVFLTDADDTYGLENLESAISAVCNLGIDMVVGTREISTGGHLTDRQERQSDFRRGHKLGNKVFVFLNRFLLGGKIDDVLSGWRVFSRRFIASFPGGSRGFEIEAQLNSHAAAIDASILNMSVSYQGRPIGSSSKLNTYGDGYRILRATLRSFKNDRPLIAFSSLALPWLLATVYLVYLPFKTYFEIGLVPNLPRLVAGVGTFLIAGLLWATGMILERVRQIRVTLLLQRYHSNS